MLSFNKINKEMSTEKEEIWRKVPGYEDCYEISNLERVKSLPRQLKRVTPL